MQPLAQPPKNDEYSFNDWMYRLWRRISSAGGLPWSVVDKTGANLTDIPIRHHDDLQYIPTPPIICFHEDDRDEGLLIPPLATYDFDHVTFPANKSLGNIGHIYTLSELMDHEWSSGVVDGGLLTDNLDGTVSIAAAISTIRPTANPHDKLFGVATAAQLNIALTDNAVNYLYLNYNAGSPAFAITLIESDVNGMDKALAYEIHRQGNVLHYIDCRNQTVDALRKSNSLFSGFSRFIHANGGSILGSTGLAITCTAGLFYRRIEPIAHVAFDTSIVGTANANIFDMWYRDGVGGWVYNANNKTINTTTYDNNTGTPVALTNNRFGVTWFYIVNDTPSELHAVMGQGDYLKLSDAAVATPPSSIPTLLSGMGVLIGVVAYEKNNTVFDAVYSVFSTTFTSSSATTHNNLSGLQGGALNEYYHLTNAQNNQIQQVLTNGIIGRIEYEAEDGQDGMSIQGPQGLTGPTGAIGAAGPQGMIGIGIDGSDGDDGFPIPGPQGPQGASGSGGGTSLNNIISTPTTIAADTSYPIISYLIITSDLTIAGNLMVIG